MSLAFIGKAKGLHKNKFHQKEDKCSMKKMVSAALCLLAITYSGCKENFVYPELSNVSEVEIIDEGNLIKKISDPLLISKLTEFINKRKEDWETPMTGFPGTKVKLYLYRDGAFIGSFGITKSSFSMQRGGRWDSKPATEQEIREMLDLLGIDKSLLK